MLPRMMMVCRRPICLTANILENVLFTNVLISLLLSDMSLWATTPQSPSSPTPTVSLKILPSLSTQDMKSAGEQYLRPYSFDNSIKIDF